MNGWDALQAYDLVNDGHGNYGFVCTKPDTGYYPGEAYKTFKLLFSLHREEKKFEREGLTGP